MRSSVLAIEILKRYPDRRVEVAGHTDSKGTDAYNQALSERRASAVYDYLNSNGIDAGRLVGPVGYGESHPIAPNTNDDGTENPEGRARNSRTAPNVQTAGSTLHAVPRSPAHAGLRFSSMPQVGNVKVLNEIAHAGTGH